MLVVFDLDGTLWRGDVLYDGATDLVKFVGRSNKVVFFSNTSTKTARELGNKLKKFGFSVNNNVYTTSSEAVRYLVNNKYNSAYIIGNDSFKKEASDSGIKITDKSSIVVVGLDFDFSYDVIEKAIDIILKGGSFIVCNEDKLFPVENKLKPGTGIITGAIEKVIGKSPDFIVGKPNTYVVENIASDNNACVRDVVIIGDTEIDALTAERIGCISVLLRDGYDHFFPVYNFFHYQSFRR